VLADLEVVLNVLNPHALGGEMLDAVLVGAVVDLASEDDDALADVDFKVGAIDPLVDELLGEFLGEAIVGLLVVLGGLAAATAHGARGATLRTGAGLAVAAAAVATAGA